MAANPILPLYYNDIDRSTRDWSDEEFGCYMRLLMHQWAQGEIPKETQRLSRIVTSLDNSWDLVKTKFEETDTGMVNLKLEEIRAERLSYLKKQQENGKKGGRKPKNNPLVNPNNNPNESLHIEYEYEDEKRKVNTGIGVQGEGDAGPPFDEVHRVFVQQGGTKQMAEHFFNTHSATGWVVRGNSVARKWSFLVSNYINNWKQNESRKITTGYTNGKLRCDPSAPGFVRDPI